MTIVQNKLECLHPGKTFRIAGKGSVLSVEWVISLLQDPALFTNIRLGLNNNARQNNPAYLAVASITNQICLLPWQQIN